jgi:hypothetical protein
VWPAAATSSATSSCATDSAKQAATRRAALLHHGQVVCCADHAAAAAAAAALLLALAAAAARACCAVLGSCVVTLAACVCCWCERAALLLGLLWLCRHHKGAAAPLVLRPQVQLEVVGHSTTKRMRMAAACAMNAAARVGLERRALLVPVLLLPLPVQLRCVWGRRWQRRRRCAAVAAGSSSSRCCHHVAGECAQQVLQQGLAGADVSRGAAVVISSTAAGAADAPSPSCCRRRLLLWRRGGVCWRHDVQHGRGRQAQLRQPQLQRGALAEHGLLHGRRQHLLQQRGRERLRNCSLGGGLHCSSLVRSRLLEHDSQLLLVRLRGRGQRLAHRSKVGLGLRQLPHHLLHLLLGLLGLLGLQVLLALLLLLLLPLLAVLLRSGAGVGKSRRRCIAACCCIGLRLLLWLHVPLPQRCAWATCRGCVVTAAARGHCCGCCAGCSIVCSITRPQRDGANARHISGRGGGSIAVTAASSVHGRLLLLLRQLLCCHRARHVGERAAPERGATTACDGGTRAPRAAGVHGAGARAAGAAAGGAAAGGAAAAAAAHAVC